MMLFVALVGQMQNAILKSISGDEGFDNFRLGGNLMFLIGDLLLFMVLYRNKLQFRGWYTERAERLPKQVTRILLGCAWACILMPFLIAFLL